VSVTDLPRTDKFEFLSSRKAHIRVDETFGGLADEVHEIDVFTGMGGGDCGIPFHAGDVYLVQASVGNDGLFRAGICSSTRRIAAPSSDVLLEILRRQRDGRKVPSLVGRIARVDRNFDGLIGMHTPSPMANTMVRVKSADKLFESRADAEGGYEFYDLPSGRYEFAPDLPAGTTLSWFIGSDKPLVPFDLRAGACQERNIDVFASGSIQGRVLDSANKLLPHAFVYIIPADEKVIPKERHLYWESQGKGGFFKFVHVPEGQYVIVVNPEDARDPAFPYQRTFYPGVHDRATASIISLKGGEQIKDVDVRLEQQFAARHLTVRVTWADGRLVTDFVHVTAKGTVNPAVRASTRQPDLKAAVIDLTTLPDETYEIEGELICRYFDERSSGPGARFKSNKIMLGPEDKRTELLLTIPATACPVIPGKTLEDDQ